ILQALERHQRELRGGRGALTGRAGHHVARMAAAGYAVPTRGAGPVAAIAAVRGGPRGDRAIRPDAYLVALPVIRVVSRPPVPEEPADAGREALRVVEPVLEI